MRSLIVKVVEGGFFALLLVGGLFLVSRTWSQSTSGAVVVASPTPAQFSPAEQEAIDRAKQYLRDHAKEYRLRPDLSDLRVSDVDLSFGSAVVGFRQLYAGYLVATTGVTVYFAAGRNDPIDVASSYNSEIVLRNVTPPYPGPNAPTIAPTLSANDAAARAFTATGAKSRFGAPPAKAELVVWPVVQPGSKTVYTLAWDVQLITTDPYGNWGVTIDAWTGEVLVKGNRFVPEPTGSSSQPFQSPVPIGPTPTAIRPTLTPLPLT